MTIKQAIYSNPIVKIGNGYMQSSWMESVQQTQTGSVEAYVIVIKANSSDEARAVANSLSTWLKRKFPPHQITVSLSFPATLHVLWSEFLHYGSVTPKRKPPVQPPSSYDSFSPDFSKDFS